MKNRINKEQKKLEKIRNILFQKYIDLKAVYTDHRSVNGDGYDPINYLEADLCDALLNSIIALEFHYRDDIERSRNFSCMYIEAVNAFRKYGVRKNPNDPYSRYRLKRKYFERPLDRWDKNV